MVVYLNSRPYLQIINEGQALFTCELDGNQIIKLVDFMAAALILSPLDPQRQCLLAVSPIP